MSDSVSFRHRRTGFFAHHPSASPDVSPGNNASRDLRRIAFLPIAASSLAGCSGVVNPHGPVAAAEKLILINSLAVMLIIVVPLIVATLAFAWWFRSSNGRAKRRPNWSFSGTLELIIWAVPALVITFLGGIAWFGAHALDPYKPLPSSTKPLEIQVVSLDWKWLFIYPTEQVAATNQLVIPTGTPIHFQLTSAGVMNSFFVPQLGSQIYTMAGMISQLNLQADDSGTYPGLSAQFSGAGFADMRFNVSAVSADVFARWVARSRATGTELDAATMDTLRHPSRNVSPTVYRVTKTGLFDAFVRESTQADFLPAPPGNP